MSKEELKNKIGTIVSQFVAECKSVGCYPPFVPSVKIKNTPQLIYYEEETLTAPYWPTLDPSTISIFDNWAKAAGGSFSGKSFFHHTFNWFLVAHELGHYVQEIHKQKLTYWDAEVNANMIAVAYWKSRNETEKLEQVIDWSQAIWRTLPNPVPYGDDPKAYFNEHYEELGSDPDAYGYFQFMFFKKAYDADPEFGNLVTSL